MRKHVFSFLPSILLFIGSLIVLVQTGNIEQLGFDPLGAAFFPKLIAGLILIFSCVDFFRVAYKLKVTRGASSDFERPSNPSLARAAFCFALFVLFCVNSAEGWFPFPWSGIAFFFTCGLVYLEKPSPRAMIILGLVSIALPVLVGFIFSYFFYVQIP